MAEVPEHQLAPLLVHEDPYLTQAFPNGSPASWEAELTIGNSKAARIGGATVLAAGILVGMHHEQTVADRQLPPEMVTEYHDEQLPITGPSSTVKIKLPGGVDNKYEEDFQTEPEDQVASTVQVSTLIEQALPRSKWNLIESVKITGLASAEDEQPGEGLQSPSQPNTGLANQRAELARIPTIKVLGNDVDLANKLTVESVEHSWTNEEVSRGNSLAQQFGYKNVGSLVVAYNDDLTPDKSSIPEDAVKFLKPLLDDNQGALIEITLKDGHNEPALVTVRVPKQVLKQRSEHVVTTDTVATVPYTIGANTLPTKDDQAWQGPPQRQLDRRPTRLNDRNRTVFTHKQPLSGNMILGRRSGDGRLGYHGNKVNRRGRGRG